MVIFVNNMFKLIGKYKFVFYMNDKKVKIYLDIFYDFILCEFSKW